MAKVAFALFAVAGLLALGLAGNPAAAAGKGTLALTSCSTGPALGGVAECHFSCTAPRAGSHGTGHGELSMSCGAVGCTVDVPATTGCDLLGLRSKAIGTCTFRGVGAAVCASG